MSTAPGVVFDAAWFARHQRVLLRLLACPIVGRWLRWVLCIRACDLGYRRRIVAIGPHYYTVAHADGTVTTDVRTHAKYGKRLYYAGLPVWRLAHAWDQWIANPFVPAWNLGFDTLTVYPDPGDPGTTTCDGANSMFNDNTWLGLRNGAGNSANYTLTEDYYTRYISLASTDRWDNVLRSRFSFDTRVISTGSAIDSATFSVCANGVNAPSYSISIDVVSVAPQYNNQSAISDFATYGTTSYTDAPKSSSGGWADFSTYVDFVLNATGRNAVNRGGITHLGLREATYDIPGIAPLWTASEWHGFVGFFSDETGTSKDPKLAVTYTPASPLTPRNRLRPRIFAPGRAK